MQHHGITDLHRAAEQAALNEQRLEAWRQRYRARFGVSPEADPRLDGRRNRWWRWQSAQRQRAAGRNEHHSNATVIRMPRRRGQYMHTRLPEPPEVA